MSIKHSCKNNEKAFEKWLSDVLISFEQEPFMLTRDFKIEGIKNFKIKGVQGLNENGTLIIPKGTKCRFAGNWLIVLDKYKGWMFKLKKPKIINNEYEREFDTEEVVYCPKFWEGEEK